MHVTAPSAAALNGSGTAVVKSISVLTSNPCNVGTSFTESVPLNRSEKSTSSPYDVFGCKVLAGITKLVVLAGRSPLLKTAAIVIGLKIVKYV